MAINRYNGAMKSGNVRKFYVFYWRHPELDWENARTTELHNELVYNDAIRIQMRHDLDYRFMNVNRSTESYVVHRSTVELFRRYKIRREPLCYIELWRPNHEGRKELFWSIDSDYRLRKFIQNLAFHLAED